MKLETEVKIDGIRYNEEYKRAFISMFTDLEREEYDTLRNIFHQNNIKMTLEVQEPILDEEERKYLSGVIRPFKDIVKGISKMKSVNKENMEYILITLADTECSYMAFPYFKKEKMYKNMKLNKRYTLEELEL